MQEPESLRAIRESPDRMHEPNRSVLLESRLQRGSRALHSKASGEVRNLLALRSSASARSVIPLGKGPSKPTSRENRSGLSGSIQASWWRALFQRIRV